MKKIILTFLICINVIFIYGQEVTISDGMANWTMLSITGTGCSSNSSFDAGNGTNQLFAVDWYIGIGTGLSQNFPPPNDFVITDTSIIAQYSDLLGITGLSAELTIIITEFDILDVQVAQLMQIKNSTGSPLDIRLFNYLDLDKNGQTTENAELFLEDDCNFITEVSNEIDPSQRCYYAVNASDGYVVLPYDELCSNLVNGLSDLNNTGLPLNEGDYTQAVQFNATIPNGGISTGETLLTFGNPPAPATIDLNSMQCSFESTPSPEFTIGQPLQSCNDDGSFSLILAFSGEADGTIYTFEETGIAGINTVSFTDDGTINEVILGTYPIGASWNIEVTSSFQQNLLNTFSGTSTCQVEIDCSNLTADLQATCEVLFADDVAEFYYVTTLTVSGANGNFTVSGDLSQPGQSFIDPATITDGSIDVVIEDDAGCIIEVSEPVSDCPEIDCSTLDADLQVTCSDDFTEYVVVLEISGGDGNYTIIGDVSSIGTSNIDPATISGGSINVEVKDGNGCIVEASSATPECASPSLECEGAGAVSTRVTDMGPYIKHLNRWSKYLPENDTPDEKPNKD